jgi:hypothetical protein
MTAPNFLSFVDKDATTLCKQIKRTSHSANEFIGHLTDDNGGNNFTATAYNGDRGLDPDRYGDIRPAPPTISHGAFMELGQKWVAAMGGELKGEESCGCVEPKIKLKIHHTWLMQVPGGFPSRESSEALFEVSLQPVKERPGYLEGQFSLDRRIDMTLPRFCKGNGSVKERWLLNALIDSVSGSVRVWHTQLSDEPTGQIECKQGGGTARMGIDPGVLAGVLGAGEMVIPPDSTSKKVEASLPGTKESLTITVLEAPPAQ